MSYLTHQLLDETTTKKFLSSLVTSNSHWEDGKKTAGSHAAEVKDNKQLDKNSKTS